MTYWLATQSVEPRSDLAWRVHEAMEYALQGSINIGPFYEIEGMSGFRYRRFINHFMIEGYSPIGGRSYLEVGSHKGSTLCAAVWQSHTSATAIDNWSEFGGPKAEFYANLARCQGDSEVTVIEEDFRKVDWASLPQHEVYLFDGPHEEQDQYDGIVLAQPALTDRHVLIVDDWNWERVRAGTVRAVRDLGLTVEYMAEIRTTLDGSHPLVWGKDSEWHNGYCIAVCRK